jgi:hypothetical protein
MSKIEVQPQRTKRKLFSFDAETDGLYGEVWAIGAVVFDYRGSEIDRFGGQLDPSDLKNQWVRNNIVQCVHLPMYQSRRALRDAFWNFWIKHKEGAICIADIGNPVESGLIRACIEDDLENRQNLGPYPLHELATMLLAKGVDDNVDRFDFSETLSLIKHNPIDDAYASAMCWLKVADN